MRRIQCLKYLVLANMLMESSVDPFDAQEAKPYKSDGEVLAMTNLVNAYQENNIKEFEKILRTNKSVVPTPRLHCWWQFDTESSCRKGLFAKPAGMEQGAAFTLTTCASFLTPSFIGCPLCTIFFAALLLRQRYKSYIACAMYTQPGSEIT